MATWSSGRWSEVGTRWHLRSLTTQAMLWFCDHKPAGAAAPQQFLRDTSNLWSNQSHQLHHLHPWGGPYFELATSHHSHQVCWRLDCWRGGWGGNTNLALTSPRGRKKLSVVVAAEVLKAELSTELVLGQCKVHFRGTQLLFPPHPYHSSIQSRFSQVLQGISYLFQSWLGFFSFQ